VHSSAGGHRRDRTIGPRIEAAVARNGAALYAPAVLTARETVEERTTGHVPCAACGRTGLVPHMDVRGDLGEDGLIPTTKQFGTALGDIVRCLACGHMQLDRFPTDEELALAYADAASNDYVSPGRLLDVGCWVGFLLAEARDRGWDGVGVEPSTFASAYAREHLGLDVRTVDFLNADLPAGHFAAVVMGDVLEHLTRAGEALDRVRELLAPGGVVVLQLPDAGSRVARLLGRRWWSVIPTHIHYFTRDSAATILGHHGYQLLDVDTDPKAFTVRYYLEKGAGYLPVVSRVLVRVAERAGVANRMWTPDFRDRMVVIARPDPR
jgi:SAM-dependent methyltransferase